MNLDIYTEEMAKSVWDKAFFMDKIIGAKCIIDFGCADGAMIRMLAPMFPNMLFFGYDINEDLLIRAESLSTTFSNVKYWRDGQIDLMIDNLFERGYTSDEICLNFSSVLHEVFSSTPEGKEVIKKIINKLHPKYITIRDMYFHVENIDLDYEKFSELQKISIISAYCKRAPGCYNKYVEKFGYIKNTKDLVHFMMKYQWRDNDYEQELKENYFAWTIKDFQDLVGNYKVIFETHYLLPYYLDQWETYGIGPKVHTHAQFILRRDE